MLTKLLDFKYKGESFKTEIAMPESIEEAVNTLETRLVFDCFLEGYLLHLRRKISGRKKRGKKRILKIDLELLSKEQFELLEALEIIKK